MIKATYWQKMEFIGSMLCFLTIISTILLCLCHRKIIYAAIMAAYKSLQVHRTDTVT